MPIAPFPTMTNIRANIRPARPDFGPDLDLGPIAKILADNPGASLGDVLVQLATPPAPDRAVTSEMPAATRLSADLRQALGKLPEVFGQVKPPTTRRALRPAELAKLEDEKVVRDAIMTALKKQDDEAKGMLNVHFDVVAERQGLAKDTTPRNDKGHYLIATPGHHEEAQVAGRTTYFTRQRTGDTTVFSQRKLEEAVMAGRITRGEYLAATEPVTGRRISPERMNKLLLSVKGRQKALRIIQACGEIKRGVNSVHLRSN